MGQVIQPQAGGGSGGSASASSLVVSTGRFAINTNDVVILTVQGIAYAAQTTNYSAVPASQANEGSGMGSITLSSGNATPANDVKQALYIDEPNAVQFVAYPNLNPSQGLRVQKVGANVIGISSVVLETDAVNIIGGINILPLTNGNLVVVWGLANTGQYFAIISKELNVVVPKTSFGVAQTSGPFIHAAVLSGGGFAIAYSGTDGNAPLLAIFTNAGAVTLAPTAIAGAPTAQSRPKVAQLSNGNLAVAIASATAAQALTRAIFTAAGAVVAAIAVVDAGTKIVGPVDISVLPNVFAIVTNVASSMKAYVQSNAGVTQGTAFSDVSSGTGAEPRLTNDGTNFWLYYSRPSTIACLVFLPITGGAGAIIYATAGNVPTSPDMVYDRDFIICGTVTGVLVFNVTQAGVAAVYGEFTTTGATTNLPCTLRVLGDFAFMKYQAANPNHLSVWRYVSMAIMGVARSSVAAGAPGTLLSINVGPASTLVNALPGAPSRSYSFATTAVVVGNQGVLLNNSISMKGI